MQLYLNIMYQNISNNADFLQLFHGTSDDMGSLQAQKYTYKLYFKFKLFNNSWTV